MRPEIEKIRNGVIRKLTQSVAHAYEHSKKPIIYQVGQWKVNIRATLPEGEYRFHFDATPKLYQQSMVDHFLYVCGSEEQIYVFPVNEFRNMIAGANLRGAGNVPNFNIQLNKHKFENSGSQKQYDIEKFFNNFSLLTKSQKRNLSLVEQLSSLESAIISDLEAFKLEEEYFEGEQKSRLTNYYERCANLRVAAIEYHGTTCMVHGCGFNFEKKFGQQGRNYIEVHHLTPVCNLTPNTKVNPQTDLVVVCSNCHRMLHRNKDHVLSLDELNELIEETGNRLGD